MQIEADLVYLAGEVERRRIVITYRRAEIAADVESLLEIAEPAEIGLADQLAIDPQPPMSGGNRVCDLSHSLIPTRGSLGRSRALLRQEF